MKVVIYSKHDCSFCIQAKLVCEGLELDHEYIDIQHHGISREKLNELAGKIVTTVPQIFVNGSHIGGYDDFAEYLTANDIW